MLILLEILSGSDFFFLYFFTGLFQCEFIFTAKVYFNPIIQTLDTCLPPYSFIMPIEFLNLSLEPINASEIQLGVVKTSVSD